MSTPPPSSAPAGWYPDPQGGSGMRWWDGAAWTEHTSAPSAATGSTGTGQPHPGSATAPTAPAGTRWNTPWIWPVLFLPLLAALPLAFLDWGALVRIDPVTGEQDPSATLAALSSPAYWLGVAGTWVVYALAVVFAYLDWRELGRRGVPAPFSWAWAFLSSYVYAIGRGVVTRRRGAGGGIVLWLAIAVLALSVLLGVGLAVGILVAVVSQIAQSPYYD